MMPQPSTPGVSCIPTLTKHFLFATRPGEHAPRSFPFRPFTTAKPTPDEFRLVTPKQSARSSEKGVPLMTARTGEYHNSRSTRRNV